MRKIIAVLTLALLLAGCATMPTGGLGDFVKTVTTTISNPVSEVDIYRVKNTYAAGLELAAEYRRYCWSASYAALMVDPVARPVCQNRRSIVRSFQKASGNAHAAILAAEDFIAKHPTLNAASAVSAAWDAVNNFKNSIPVAKG